MFQSNLPARGRLPWLLGMGAALALVAGCESPGGVSVRKNGSAPQVLGSESDLLPKSGLSFLLSPLDRVHVQILPMTSADGANTFEPHDTARYEFSLHGGDYHILPGDELTVRFGADPKSDLTVTVRPDGKVTLANDVDIQATGRTPIELSSEIDAAYHERMPKAATSVSVTKSNLALAEISGESVVQPDGTFFVAKLGSFPAIGLSPSRVAETLSSSASKYFGNTIVVQLTRVPALTASGTLVGFDKTIVVSPDGLLALPEVGYLDTKGQSTAGLQAEIAEALKVRYRNPFAVLVAIESSDSRVVYVDGEVGRPGAYPLTPALTVLKALTVAGGLVDTGDLQEVFVIHRNETNDVFVYVTNLREFIQKGVRANDLALSPQDIVVVPKTSVAKANLWIDQYINRMLPFSRGVNYSYNQGKTTLNP
ncbi:MAG TPA: polysaccharide biosynthesis/export family protein [Opitutaceae bacterium]